MILKSKPSMDNTANLLHSVFSSSLEDLRQQYAILSAQSIEERERFVVCVNSKLAKVQQEIEGEQAASAKRLVLKFLFITRVQCKSEGLGDCGLPSERIYQYLVGQVVGLDRGEKHEVESWQCQRPTEAQFLDVISVRLAKNDFYTQVRFLCDQVYGVRLPSVSETSVESWAKSAGLSEEAWAWQYKSLLEKEHSRWFTSKKRIAEVEWMWQSHRKDIVKCMESLSPLFPGLGKAGAMLERLKLESLSLSVRCDALNRAYEALKQGVQLKHLLLEEGHELGKMFGRIL